METLTPRWAAVWTRSRHEKLVRDHLVGKDIEVFLPLVERPSLRKDRREMVEQPVFPGYLFARLTPYDAAIVKATRGVVQILGPAPDSFSTVPDEQVEAVRTMVESRLTVDPYPYLKVGTRVEVKHGPMKGLQGILVDRRKRLRLVISVDLLGKSISAEVSAEQVEEL